MKDLRLRESFYHALPDRFTSMIESEARYARIDNPKNIVTNTLLAYYPLLAAVSLIVNIPIIFKILIIGIAAPVGLFIPYSFVTLAAEKRKKEIEKVLSDALLLMSANIKSGLTVDKAFLLAARDEFGPLADEIRITAMQMFGGKPVEEALSNLKTRTNSGMLQEVIKLLIDGVKSGGELSNLLESSAKDIRKTLSLRKEISSNVQMYVLFIIMAAVFGSPLLFGISNYLTGTTAELWGSTNVDISELPTGGLFSIQKPEFKVQFFFNFSIVAIIITNVFAAFIISEIKNGNIKEGIKYAPGFVVVALIIFFVVRSVVENVVGGLV